MNLDTLQAMLDQRAGDPEGISDENALQQLRSVVAIHDRLTEHGGAILGDEVGLGKTFTTFALITAVLAEQPERGVVVFAPSDEVKRKWARQMREYFNTSVRDPRLGSALARRVMTVGRDFAGDDDSTWGKRPRKDAIVIARTDVFAGQVKAADRAACLHAWLELRGPRPKPRKRLMRACGVHEDHVHGDHTWAQPDALTRTRLAPLDEVYARYQAGERDVVDLFRARVRAVRRKVGAQLLRNPALVVIDEAHKLRNPDSASHRAFAEVLAGGFDSMLFLTATPFQLGRHELQTVVGLFRHANRYADREREFEARVREMTRGMDDYVRVIRAFGRAWDGLSQVDVTDAVRLALDRDAIPDERTPAGRASARFRDCLGARARLEQGLRPFLVRSLLERHREEHFGIATTGVSLAEESRIPIALVDRLITDLLAQRKRTFIASALTTTCSSWDALLKAAVMVNEATADSASRRSLERMHRESLLGPHPKVEATTEVCLAGVARGEKTLVFVERVETGLRIREQVMERLGDWHDKNAWARLQDPERFGWPSLRENYLHTLFPEAFGVDPPAPSTCLRLVRADSTRLWTRVAPRRGRDYKIEKRFIEHVVFADADRRLPSWRARVSEPIAACVERLLDPRYVLNGLDLLAGAEATTLEIPEDAPGAPRGINEAFVRAYAAYPSPWKPAVRHLRLLGPDQRARVVDAAATAIATSHLQEQLSWIRADGEPARHFRAMAKLLGDEHRLWPTYFTTIAEAARDRLAGQEGEVADIRLVEFTEALRSSQRVQFLSSRTSEDRTRDRAIQGFNSPLYPQVLIATRLFAEGLDLHRSCRRVVHHDLPWNPAELEQRTGRIDRLGSLSVRLRRAGRPDRESSVEIWYPYMLGTYDQSIFDRVMARRQEFRCVLGERPEWGDPVADADDPPPEIDERLIEALQVDLGPRQ